MPIGAHQHKVALMERAHGGISQRSATPSRAAANALRGKSNRLNELQSG
jgi:hypothetical protein